MNNKNIGLDSDSPLSQCNRQGFCLDPKSGYEGIILDDDKSTNTNDSVLLARKSYESVNSLANLGKKINKPCK